MPHPFRIIPAVDLISGKCVRLEQGKFDRKHVYESSPLDTAKKYEDHGLEYIHIVDLDAAKGESTSNLDVVEQVATHTSLQIDFGGGVRSDQRLRDAFNAGATQVSCGSIAITEPDKVTEWLSTYGADRIIIGIDLMDEKIATHGWQTTTDTHWRDIISHYHTEHGATYFVCTDISRDGMLSGISMDLYKNILSEFPHISLIASGGVRSMEDVEDSLSAQMGGIIIGKAIYENKIQLSDLEAFVSHLDR